MAPCLPWVESELALVHPEALVLLGATAAQGLLGPMVRVTRDRGAYPSSLAALVVVTVHPSAVLRQQTRQEREDAFDGLVRDLRLAADHRLIRGPHSRTMAFPSPDRL